jgi:hypothetical protein
MFKEERVYSTIRASILAGVAKAKAAPIFL